MARLYKTSCLPGSAVQARSFDWSSKIAATLISMLGMLIVTGILSMVTLYTRVSTLAESVQGVQAQQQRAIDHTIDRDEYLRRDAQVQRALDAMATKDELKSMQRQLDQQTETLAVIESAVSSRSRRFPPK